MKKQDEHQHLIKKQDEHQDLIKKQAEHQALMKKWVEQQHLFKIQAEQQRVIGAERHSISLRNRLLAQSVTYLRWRILLHLFSSLFDEVGYW